MKCSINSPALSLLMKHLVIGQRLKTPNFSAFHWSPHCSLVSIGQNFVTTRVVHLPKRTETSLITELDQSGPNHQLLQLCTARTVWSESDQAVRAVHSCISWLSSVFLSLLCIPPFNPEVPEMKIVELTNSVDLDKVAHNEPPHQDLHCLPSIL